MLKTVRELIRMMKSQRKKLCWSLLFSFLDGFLLVMPLMIAFYIVSCIPELFPAARTPLTMEMVFWCSAAMILCIVLRIALRYLTLRFRSGAGYIVMSEERKKLGRELRKVSMSYFNQKNLGDLVATVTSDASFIELDGLGVLEKVAAGIPALIIGILILALLDWRIALISCAFLMLAYLAYRRLSSTQRRLGLYREKLVSEVTEDIVEFTKGLRVLKTYNMEEKQFFKTKVSFAKLKKHNLKVELCHIPSSAVFQLCFRAVTAAIILLAGIFFLQGETDFPTAFLLMLGAFSLFSGAELMGIYSIFSFTTQEAMDRIKQVQNIPKMDDKEGKEALAHFDIALEHVTFAYEEKPVLKDIHFVVPERTTTALVGLSGSGKTTITNLIARFWDTTQGQVLLGGKNIKDIPYETVLKNLSFVFQDVFLFDDTILNNIRLGNPSASPEEVVEAARRAQCHDFIMQLENGYDTMVGEGGAKLSGGEKQRISIARALIKNAPIVLLDEVTANVDVENEQKIQMALQELLRDRTVVMIAHKLSTLQYVDQILVIEDGTITQRGRHQELIQEPGLYQRLWNLQEEADRWKL